MKKILYIFVVVFTLISCNGTEPVYFNYNTNPSYTWGYVEFFGQEYASKGVNYNVLSVSLFSDSLSVDSTGSLVGIGQYLYLEDVFVNPTDTMLPVGTYTISGSKTSFMITPGKNDTVDYGVTYPIGASIYYYENNSSKSVRKYIKSGTMTVSRTGILNYSISCDFVTADKKQLKGSFSAQLPHFDESLQKTPGMLSKRHFLARKY